MDNHNLFHKFTDDVANQKATDSKNAHALRMSGITKSFDGAVVLNDVMFELFPGETHVLAGENGAGKSTLIKILCGVHTEYSGKIEIDGKPVKFSSAQDAAQKGISAIHQELSLVPSLSVADNIFLGREITNKIGCLNFDEQKKKSREILNRLNLDLDLEQKVENLPVSIQQMIEIAKALAIDSRFIIMDEPTSALTEPEVKNLFKVIENLKKQNKCIVYITHKMEELYAIADRISVLRDGRYIGTSKANELPVDELIKWMVGREIKEFFPDREFDVKEELLRVENITISNQTGTKTLVDNVSFCLKKGEVLGIGGLQGSGASELLNGIFGTYGKLKDAKIFLEGKKIKINSPAESIRNGIALLTNDRKTTGLVLIMGVDENITLASVPKYSPCFLLSRSKERLCAQRHQKHLNIKAANLQMETSSLSGGNQQKVAIAKWIESNPKVLLLDEPTRGIDIAAKREMYELINKWTKEDGLSIMLITSEMPELLALSDRIIVMHRGTITGEYAKKDATQEKILHAAMGHITNN